MENKVVNTSISGIKCDADGCDYRDDDVAVEQYNEWLNKPCPMCGANLLTEEDLAVVNAFTTITNEVNSLMESLGIESPSDAERKVVRVELNGTGFDGMEITDGDSNIEEK